MADKKYIRINDVNGLSNLKADEIFIFWKSDSTGKGYFRTLDGKFVSDKVESDLIKAMQRGWFDISDDKSKFPKDRSLSHNATNKVEGLIRHKENEKDAKHPNEGKPASEFLNHNIDNQLNLSPPPKPVIKKTKPVKRTAAQRKDDEEDKYPTLFKNFTPKEQILLHQLAYLWRKGTIQGWKKYFESQDRDNRTDDVNEYIHLGLAKKNVEDDDIPPLNVLKKIPIISHNRELLLYYERKLNRGAGQSTENSSSFSFKNAIKIDKNALPTSWKIAANVGSGLVSMLSGTSRLAGNLLKSGKKEEGRNLPKYGNSLLDKLKNTISPNSVPKPRWLDDPHNPDSTPLKEKSKSGKKEDKDHKVEDTKSATGILKKIDNNISKLLAAFLAKGKSPREKDAKNISGKDVTDSNEINHEIESNQEHDPETKKSSKKSGIFGLLTSMVLGAIVKFRKLLEKMFSGVFDVVKGAFKIVKGFGSILESIGKSIFKAIEGLAKIAYSFGKKAVAGIVEGGKKVLGTAGKVGSKVLEKVPKNAKTLKMLKGAAGGLASLAGGYVLDKASDYETKKGNVKTGAGIDTASDALTGAGIGAEVGSVVPVVGTAIGAGIGGLAGAGYGLYHNWNTLTASQKNKAAPIVAANEQVRKNQNIAQNKQTDKIVQSNKTNNNTATTNVTQVVSEPRNTDNTIQRWIDSKFRWAM